MPGAAAVKAEPMADTDGQAQGLDGQLEGPSHAEDGEAPPANANCKQVLLGSVKLTKEYMQGACVMPQC